MSTHNICFHGEIRKLLPIFGRKRHLMWSYGYDTEILYVLMSTHYICFRGEIRKLLPIFSKKGTLCGVMGIILKSCRLEYTMGGALLRSHRHSTWMPKICKQRLSSQAKVQHSAGVSDSRIHRGTA